LQRPPCVRRGKPASAFAHGFQPAPPSRPAAPPALPEIRDRWRARGRRASETSRFSLKLQAVSKTLPRTQHCVVCRYDKVASACQASAGTCKAALRAAENGSTLVPASSIPVALNMLITDIRAHHLRIPYDAGVARFRHGTSGHQALDMVVVEVSTDQGITG